MSETPAAGSSRGALHASTRLFRYTLLLFVAMLTFGSYFAYDSVAAIETTLMKALKLDRQDIGNLYAAYSIAAIPIVFLGGVLIDKLGTRRASLLFASLVAIGAAIVAAAESKTVLFLGRFVFGAGSESLVVAQSAIIARWFKGKELALAFGISLTVSRLGTLFTFNTAELIADHWRDGPEAPPAFRVALWAAFGLCVLSLLANVVYIVMDRRGERQLGLHDEGTDKFVFGDIARFGAPFWFVTILCVTFYSAIFPFTALATDMFHDKWGYPLTVPSEGSFVARAFASFLHMFDTAPGVTSIIIFASMVFAPFAGTLVDRIGRRASMMIVGSIILIPCHLLLGLSTISPVVAMIPLGAAFVLVPAAMWPSVPLVVDKNRVGTAFGLMTAIQNVGLGAFPMASGWLRDETHSYTASQIMFASLGVVGLIAAVLLLRADRASGGRLEAPGHAPVLPRNPESPF